MKEILKSLINEQAAQYICDNYPSAKMLMNATDEEINRIPHLSPTKAKDIKSIITLCKEILKPDHEIKKITSPKDVYEHLQIMEFYEEEQFNVLMLTTKNTIIDTALISKGSLSASIVHPREVFSSAIRMKAAGIVCVHNHPSADPEPSTEDIETTKRLSQAGDILGIKVVDHIIIGASNYISLKERGIL